MSGAGPGVIGTSSGTVVPSGQRENRPGARGHYPWSRQRLSSAAKTSAYLVIDEA